MTCNYCQASIKVHSWFIVYASLWIPISPIAILISKYEQPMVSQPLSHCISRVSTQGFMTVDDIHTTKWDNHRNYMELRCQWPSGRAHGVQGNGCQDPWDEGQTFSTWAAGWWILLGISPSWWRSQIPC